MKVRAKWNWRRPKVSPIPTQRCSSPLGLADLVITKCTEVLSNGWENQTQMAIGLVFGSLVGPLAPDEIVRLNALRGTVELWSDHGHYLHLVDSALFF